MNDYLFNKKAEERKFILVNGKELHTIKELYQSLDNMSAKVFSHHVTTEKNDFSLWIKHVFSEDKLSYELFQANSKKEMKQILGDWITQTIHELRPKKKKKHTTKSSKSSKEEPKQEISHRYHHIDLVHDIIIFALGTVFGAIIVFLFL